MIQEEKYKRRKDKNIKGILLKDIRLSRGISAEEICQGVCSMSMYSNIELGRRVPPKIVMDTFWQRAGISTEQMESVVPRKEYEIIVLMDKIAEAVNSGNAQQSKELLDKFYFDYAHLNKLHLQNYLMLKAVNAIYVLGDYEEAGKNLDEAMTVTFPQYDGRNMTKRKLSYTEMCIYILTIMVHNKLSQYVDMELAKEYFYNLKFDMDIHDYARICPQFAYVLGNTARKLGLHQLALDISGEGLSSLKEFKRLYRISSLLELWSYSVRKTKETEFYEEADIADRMRENFDAMYEEFEVSEDNIVWCLAYGTSEIYPLDVVVRVRRKALGITQEYLSTGICDNMTVSRIERGMTNPKNTIRGGLLRTLGMDSTDYGKINAKSYQAYILENEMTKALNSSKYEKAWKLLLKLKKLLDLDDVVNNQYISYMKILLRMYMGKPNPANIQIDLYNVLRYTYTGHFKDTWIYSRNETNIIVNIARMYAREKKYQHAIKILRTFCSNYRNANRNHAFPTYNLAVFYYGTFLGSNEDFEEAIEVTYNALAFELREGGSITSARKMYDMGWNLEKQGEASHHKKSEYEKYIRYAYYLSLIVDNEKGISMIEAFAASKNIKLT